MLKPYITVTKDSKYTIHSEKPEDWDGSFFKEVYQKAIDLLEEIYQASIKSLEKDEFSLKQQEISKATNIIAFIGERGSGKSSVMFSFIEAFKEAHKEESGIRKFIGKENNKEFFDKTCFEIMDTIDPSLFEENDNILEIVISQMFKKFKVVLENDLENEKIEYENKRALLIEFEKAYKSLKVVEKDINFPKEELIEEISRLSAGSKLRENIRTLIDEYLKFFLKDNGQNFLVVIIDDFDLNIKHALEMAESIRKYLFLPNVIILTAMNYDDLFLLIQQSHTIYLEPSLKYNQIDNKIVNDKSFRYLKKFLPYSRQLILPNVREERNSLYLYFDNSEEKLFFSTLIINTVITEVSDYIFRNPAGKEKISYEPLKKELSEIIYSFFPLNKSSNIYEIKQKVVEKTKTFLIDYYGEAKFKEYSGQEGRGVEGPAEKLNYIEAELNKDIGRKLEFKLLRFIEFKTGLNFFPSFSDGKYDSLLPDALRELRELIFLLYEMTNIVGQDKSLRIKNTNIFKKYFFDNWIKKNLTAQNKELFNSVINMDYEYVNQTAKEKIFENFIDSSNKLIRSENNSLISLLYLFRDIKKNENTVPFLFALKYHFSMKNTISLFEEDYLQLSSLMDVLTIQNKNDLLISKPNLESLKFVVKPKEVYKKIQVVFSLFLDNSERLNFQNEKNELSQQLKQDILKDDPDYKNPSKEKIIEVLEWLFLFFRFFTRDNPYYSIYRERYNYFQNFLKLLRSDNNPFVNVENEKEFLLSDLIGIEFYIYSCKDLYKKADLNTLLKLGIKNWTTEQLSMAEKLKLYRSQSYSSAIPIYNLEIFDRILPDESIIDKLSKSVDPPNNFIINFYNTFYSQFRNVDMEFPAISFLRNPIFSPFLEYSAKGVFFQILFNFVFSNETTFLKEE